MHFVVTPQVNHGCDEINIDGKAEGNNGRNADDVDDKAIPTSSWEAVFARRSVQACTGSRAAKPILAGEPFLENYKEFDFADGSLDKNSLTKGWCP
jgi:hypothetical protein